ncbi:MAG: hypothetical protein NT133_25840 [Alphaproteobacteria bacterium]|nr:hypothetical protein [Alphaproteobacteria bacterium]
MAKYPDAAGNIGVSAASVFTLVSPIAGVVTHGASADFTSGGVGMMSSGVGNAGTAAGAIDLAAVGGDRVGGSDLRGQTGWQAPVQSGFVTAGGGGEAGLDPMVLDLIFATTGTNTSIWNITQ